MAGATTVTVFAQTDPGRVRANNEDNFVAANLTTGEVLRGAEIHGAASWEVGPKGVLLVVSDGMGGEQAGEVASNIVVEAVLDELSGTDNSSDRGDEIRAAVEAANAKVWDAAREPNKKGMGATLTAILIRDTIAFIAEVGDSRAYLLRGAQLRQVTRDQSYVQLLVDSGLLKPEDAPSFPLKNVILQAMGHGPEIVVALGKLALRRGDRFLLCSDGLYGMVKDEEMRDALLLERDLGKLAGGLVSKANKNGGDDNITVIVADVAGQELPVAPTSERVTLTLEAVTEFQGPTTSRPPPPGDSGEMAAIPSAPPAPSPSSKPPRGSGRPAAGGRDTPTARPPKDEAPASERAPAKKEGGSWVLLVLVVALVVGYLVWRSL